jgi:tetratricopeptide (TPR) repeat protein
LCVYLSFSDILLNAGLFEQAVSDADTAVQLLHALGSVIEENPSDTFINFNEALSKAYHRKAQAQIASGHIIPALRTYKEGLAACSGARGLAAATRLALDEAPATWFAAYWAKLVDAAQQPHRLSSRDGKLLKLVPKQNRCSRSELHNMVNAFLLTDTWWLEEAKSLVWNAWTEGRTPGRAEIAFFRAAAYLQINNTEQAQRDSLVALSYGPKDSPTGTSTWAAALLLYSSTLELKGENVPALLHAARAAEIEESAPPLAINAVDRLLRRVPEHYADAIRSGGVERLNTVLKMEKERDMPPFLKPKPKYYYYYEWMRKRIEARHPQLPSPVMDKLLTMDANELDLLLQYPAAIDGTVRALERVLENKGEEGLATWTVPLLSWEEKKEFEQIEQKQQLLLEQGVGGKNGFDSGLKMMDTDDKVRSAGNSVKSISEEEEEEGEENGDGAIDGGSGELTSLD